LSKRLAVSTAAIVLALLVFVATRAVWHDGSPAPTGNFPETNENDVEAAAKTPNEAAAGTWSILETSALEAREIGMWDDFRVGSPVVMKDAGHTGFRMWYLGCRFGERQYDCGIGHATSADGVA
jgi:hypothetical protein